jgi:hypothetical protein
VYGTNTTTNKHLLGLTLHPTGSIDNKWRIAHIRVMPPVRKAGCDALQVEIRACLWSNVTKKVTQVRTSLMAKGRAYYRLGKDVQCHKSWRCKLCLAHICF